MSESKTIVFGDGASGSNNLLASILPALQNKGVDTGYLLGMLNNGNNGGLFGGRGFEDIIALIIVAAIFGNGNFGFGNGNGNNNAERELIASMIQRNGVDISQLASTLNCSVGRIDDAIGNVATQICNLTGQVGMNSMQIINAVQAGNTALASQICNCCCDVKQLIAESNYLTERGFCNTNQILAKGFSDIGYASQAQTGELTNVIKDSTAQILAGQAAIEKRELQREIATLQDEKQTYRLGSMIQAATSPILAEVESLKCKLPKTEVVNVQPEYVPINRGINVAYAPYCANGFNTFGGWNNCGFNNNFAWG